MTDIPAVQVFDLRAAPCRLGRREWQPRLRRDPSEFAGVVLHSWGTKVGTTGANRIRHGSEVRALADRALDVPYGITCGVTALSGEPVVTIAHPIERYTNASDAGNRHWLAVGVMGLFAYDAALHNPARHTAVTDALLAAIDHALREAVRLVHEAQMRADGLSDDDIAELGGSCGRPLALITHRQCANEPRDHFACPGEAVVEAALASDAVRSGLLVPDPDRVLLPEFGKPWPESWRRHLSPRAVDPIVPRLDERQTSLVVGDA